MQNILLKITQSAISMMKTLFFRDDPSDTDRAGGRDGDKALFITLGLDKRS